MVWLDEGSASTLRPGRRPRTTLSPTLVLRDGVSVAALGTPGGDQQDQWQLLLPAAHARRRLDPAAGDRRPDPAHDGDGGLVLAAHLDPGGVVAEDRLGDEVLDGLEARGHAVTRCRRWTLGRLSA